MDTIQALLPKTLEAKKLWAQQVCSLAKDNLVRGNKIATGQLLNSITYEIDLSTGDILFMYDEYGDFVEDGRRPGRMPPIEPIRIDRKSVV